MDIRKFTEQVFNVGKAAGFSDMEVFITKSKDFQVKVFQQEVDDYSLSEVRGVGLRGKHNGKMGYAYTEITDQLSVDLLVDWAKQNAQIIDSTDDIEIFTGSDSYPTVEAFNLDFQQVTVDEKIVFAKELEEYALQLDPRVTSVNYALYADGESEVYMANTKGLERSFRRNGGVSYVMVVVKEGEQVKTGTNYVVGNQWDKFQAKQLVKDAVEEAVSLLNADSIESKAYPVILRNDVAASILSTFSSVFSAEAVQRGLSLLGGKLGATVAASIVTIMDDPLLPDAAGSAPFDGEGVATRTKEVVKQGELKTFLHNLKTAKKDGVQSTGNASKASFKAPVTIAPSNLFIQPGLSDYQGLIKEMQEGLVIISVQGLHSGANPVSGDFSLAAYGYYVKDGKIARPVDQITIAGNFFELLQEVENIGNDLKFALSGGAGSVGSPSLLIKSLAVAGK